MNKIVCVAQDTAPSGCFKRLEPVLRDRGFEVNLFIGEGNPMISSEAEIIAVASTADLVLLGMSSSPELAKYEIATGEAARNARIPYGFYGDVRGCWARAKQGSWFADLAPLTAFYFGATQTDAEAAREVFPKAYLIGTGNPVREEMAFPSFTREQVREKFDIAPDEKLILAPGTKLAAGNMASWVMLVDALTLLSKEGRSCKLFLAVHPGDRTDRRLYEELAGFSPVPTNVITKEMMTMFDMASGADIIVGFGESNAIMSSYQNVPMIFLGFEVTLEKFRREMGASMLEAVNDGIAELVVADAGKLEKTIRRLLTLKGFAKMRERQRELYPKPAVAGDALRKMVNAIAQIA